MMIISFICTIIFLVIAINLIAAVLISLRGQESGMARLWLSEIANDIRGSIKNHTYSIWKGLNYLRQKAASISNPCSGKQTAIRAKTTAASKRWYDTVTRQQRALWNEYAEGMAPKAGDGGGTRQIIPDNRGTMSGYNAYIMLNLWAFSAEVIDQVTFIDDAPVGVTPPNAPTVLTSTWNDQTCCVDLTWTDPIEAIEDTKVRVWLVSLQAGAHKQMRIAIVLGAQAYSVCNVYAANGQVFNIRDLPGNYYFQVDAIGPNGQKSPPSNVKELMVPAECTPA